MLEENLFFTTSVPEQFDLKRKIQEEKIALLFFDNELDKIDNDTKNIGF